MAFDQRLYGVDKSVSAQKSAGGMTDSDCLMSYGITHPRGEIQRPQEDHRIGYVAQLGCCRSSPWGTGCESPRTGCACPMMVIVVERGRAGTAVFGFREQHAG